MKKIKKMKKLESELTTFLPLDARWDFFADAQGLLTSQSLVEYDRNKTRPRYYDVLLTCKYEEEPIKNESA